jgi:metal-responsive CopG/Arc/MetJ family transcriptional regulator
MRHVVSISLSEDTILKLREKLRHSHDFRNKSHLIEYAIERFLVNENKPEKNK